jgi:ATP-binding cassette subfamily B protein
MTAAAAPGLFASLAALTLVQGLLPLAGLVLASRVVDAVAARNLHTALVFLTAAAGVAVLAAASSSLSSVLSESFSETVRDDVTERIHRQSASIDLAYYEDPSFHDTLHRAQREGTWRAPRLALGLSQLAREAAALAAMGALLATLRWWLAAVLVLVSIPGVLVRLRFSHRLFGLQTEAAHAERAASYHSWLLTGPQWAAEVRLLGLGPWLRQRFSALRLTLRTRRLSLASRRAGADAVAQALAAAALFGTFAYLAKLAVAGGLTIGAFVMYFGAVQRGLSALQGLLSSLASLYEDRLFLRHLDAFLDLSPRVVDPAAPRPFPTPIYGGIRLDAVTFRYAPGQPPALDGVTLEIPAGKVLALVGLNGSGKSTLVKLLLRLYDPESGTIAVDNIDLRDIAGTDVRRHAPTLLQDYGRFAFSARENVALGDVGRLADLRAADPRLLRAAHLSGALSDVESLPRGWDTVLGNFFDDGRELSAGQWQKLALARTLYRDEAEAPLLILDEPSASLDPLAERDFVDRLVEAARGRTTVLVSHRFSSVRSADRIAVLDAGRLVETGTHDDLLRAGGLYARMFAVQADPYR